MEFSGQKRRHGASWEGNVIGCERTGEKLYSLGFRPAVLIKEDAFHKSFSS